MQRQKCILFDSWATMLNWADMLFPVKGTSAQ